jgi:hypothetical protein
MLFGRDFDDWLIAEREIVLDVAGSILELRPANGS